MRPTLPRYVQPIKSKGTTYLYFRRHGRRWRLPGQPGEPEFNARYLELLGQTNTNPEPKRIAEGTVAAMIRDYRADDEFLGLKPKTQRDYGRMLDLFSPVDRHHAEAIRRKHIRELRKGLAGKARTQKLFTQVASVLFNFGIDNDYCSINPAARMERIGRAKSYIAWSDAQCTAFEASNPPRNLMTGYMIARYAGQRRGDILKMARTAYDGSCIEVRQEKTDEPLIIPAHRRLRAHLDQLPKDSLLFVVDAQGQPLDETKFSKEFRAALYTKAARQKRLATAAIAKLEGTGTEQESGKPDE